MSEVPDFHVTHIISCPASGGAEVYVKDLSLYAAQSGRKVSIIFLDRAEEAGRDEEYQKAFLGELEEAGISFEFIGAKARRNPIFGWFRLRKVLRKLGSDIVHAHLLYAVIFSAMCGMPVIYTHHSVKLRMPKMFYRLILNKIVSRYVGISVVCAQVLRDAGCRPVTKINNGVNVSRLLTGGAEEVGKRRMKTNSDRPFTFLAVGRLVAQKNYPRLLSAMARLSNDKSWRLQIAGEGGERKALEELVLRLELTGKVEFLGNVNDVGELLASADAFVMSSEWEGLPIALIEATLIGLPVVVTNVGGCAEVVHTAYNGIVVDEPGDESLASALERLLSDEELRSSFSRNALLYGSKYELSTAHNEHLRLYSDTIFGEQKTDAQCAS